MTENEKLTRDIDTLLTTIKSDWEELGTRALTPEDRTKIKIHLKWCALAMQELTARLDNSN